MLSDIFSLDLINHILSDVSLFKFHWLKLNLVLALCLLASASGLITITNDVSFTALCSERINNLVRVEKLVNVTYIYSLNNVT